MFVRHSVRVVQQSLRPQYRLYATKPSSSDSNTFNAFLYSGIAAVLAGSCYYLYKQNNALQKVKDEMYKAEAEDTVQNIAGGAVPKSTFTGGDQGFISLKLDSVETINHNTKKFRFSLPDRDAVSGLHIASALLTRYKGPEMEKPVVRPYTPISDEDQKGYLDLLVKRYHNGPMSEHLHSMEPNQLLEFRGPLPKYPWSPNKHSHIGLIAGGTGITPMYQLIRAIFKNPDDKTKVTLVFGNIKEEDILLKREFENLENTYPQRFCVFYVLNEPPNDSKIIKGMITKELLKTALPEPKMENIKLFVCGPPGLYKAISGGKTSPSDQGELEGYLKELGYSKEQVYKF